MANPFEKKRIPGIQREAPPVEEEAIITPEEPEAPEVELEPESELLNPAKVLYTTERCSSCEYFLGESCKKVSGSISPEGWCILHELKTEPMAEAAMELPA